jgi:uncharacterized protein YfaS (alpha-2-macroglobulin family)
MRIRSGFAILALAVSVQAARAQTTLTVTSAQPAGELASLEQAAEIRVRFSEPMVALGRVPEQVTAPFFSIQPSVAGTFRWAGPTLLVFTPDPKRPLPRATRFDVTIAASAAAVSGRTLGRPYSFSFVTPTARLLSTEWYRAGGRFDRPVVLPLRFNQRVRPADVLAHISARYQRHDWPRPALSAAERAYMGAAAASAYDAKVAATAAAAVSEASVPLKLAADWDRKRFPPSPDLVVLETVAPPATDGWILLTVDRGVPAAEGAATPAGPQSRTVVLERTLFVDDFSCVQSCDADAFNIARLRALVPVDVLRSAVSVRDITPGSAPADVPRPASAAAGRRRNADDVYVFTLEDLGYNRQAPARTYAISLGADVRAVDGQTLGYAWTGIVENWHERAFTSFGDGHGVWEAGGGPLPFYARNFVDVRRWAEAIAPDRLMPTIIDLTAQHFHQAPPGDGVRRVLGGATDKVLSHGLDLAGALKPSGRGLVWAAVRHGDPIEHARAIGAHDVNATIVQVTNLGITVKDSPQNTLVFVTALDSGAPVAGADVSIVRLDNSQAWRGRTDDQGVAMAPAMTLRKARQPWKFAFIVTASKGDDVAYVASDWNQGIEPYAFGAPYDVTEAEPLLRGTVFPDRGVYKLGEDVHLKAVLRRDRPGGIELIPNRTPLYVTVRDSRNKVVDRRTVAINAWSTTEWTLRLPGDGALGDYQVSVTLDKSLQEERTPRPPESGDEEEGWQPDWKKTVTGRFLVAAYRRPEFRVDATLAAGAPPAIAGAQLKGAVTARYLFGAPMANRPVAWTYTREPFFQAPAAVTDKYPADRFAFVGCCEEGVRPEARNLGAKTASLDARGQLALDLDTQPSDGLPYQYTIEGDVEDVSRQHIAGRASLVVHPAPWYIGLQRPPLFLEQKDGLKTSVVAVGPDGTPVPGVRVELTLVEVQWHSVRRAEGNGFYTWESERKEVEAGRTAVTTAADPVPVSMALPAGGAFMLRASAVDGALRSTTRLSLYALGTGYTAWARYDHNRIDLVPEKESYKPGETARLMIQSPWEQATALLTVEREGIRSHSQFALTSTQQTVTVPITAADIPNLFVSVLLIKGRTPAAATEDTSDPGRPSFRLGYAKLRVEDASKRLSLSVKANKEEFRPAGSARVDLEVHDAAGAGASSEVTLWAVDYGVLSLTGFRTPDVLESVYVPKALEVMTEDNRQRLISRRVLTPKGTDEGGGGGAESGVNQLRKDFRVLAFWLGSIETDARGHAAADVKLPESLTTYRIMAVAGDRLSRFGSGESEIRINKPVVLKAAFPRFLTKGDTATFGSVVTSQLKQPGTAIVTMRSLDPSVLQVNGETRRIVQVPAGGSTEVRFDLAAKATGRARVQTSVTLQNETDAFEDSIPVQISVTPESVAAYGEAAPDARQPFELPAGVVPGFGGLHLELSSTALVGLGEGARYVVEYPYGCVEQRASRAFVLATAADLGGAFKLPGIDAGDLRPRVQSELRELEKFQCPSGGFAFWPGACRTVTPFMTSYVLHVYQTAASLGYGVDSGVMQRGYDYLQGELGLTPPLNEGWWPSYTAWEAFAVKVLVDGGRNQDSNVNRLFGYLDRMPVFAFAYLHDALVARHEAGPRLAELRRRMSNAVLPEAGSAHVEELSDPYLLWFFNSNVRSTALVVSTLVRADAPQAEAAPFVRWLVAARKDGRWNNTQENAIALQALVAYYRKYESAEPNFTATVRLGSADLVRAAFKGRTTTATTKDVPLASLAPGGSAPRELQLHREGEGTLYYAARVTYAPDVSTLTARDLGIHVEREYAPMVDGKAGSAATAFSAGDLVRVTLSFDLPKERRYVAVTDPVPAGFEPVESWFATTASDVAKGAEVEDGTSDPDWQDVWKRGEFDHVERHDDRVLLFATRLAEGHHEFSYVVRATTSGTFRVAPARAEEMYAPEISGRTSTQTIEVRR